MNDALQTPPPAAAQGTSAMTPREIVQELDRHIVGQQAAKRAVAIALRNRWRRQQTPEAIRGEITPKNILMIGPTGVGKTEIARRLAKLANAPFVKVEATKFTEVGYVGRDVEQIVRDLVEIAIGMTRERLRKEVEPKAEIAAEERVLEALVGSGASADTRQKFRKMLREGALDDREIEVAVQESAAANLPTFEIPGLPGAQMGMLNLGDIFGKTFGSRSKPKRMTVADSHRVLVAEESDKLLDQEMVLREATTAV
ncbi:MAG TPA: AAA family ATPase, partial [Nevskia sp.]|nr:AAA family ATPase [Nevskia sp.]